MSCTGMYPHACGTHAHMSTCLLQTQPSIEGVAIDRAQDQSSLFIIVPFTGHPRHAHNTICPSFVITLLLQLPLDLIAEYCGRYYGGDQ